MDRREFLRLGAFAALGVTATAAAGRGLAGTSELACTSHLFPIAWPLVQPAGAGGGDAAALGEYSRTIDALLEAGVQPMPTLFTGGLPRALEQAGGWSARDTAARYGDYASIVADALGDRIESWILLDDPPAFLVADYVEGRAFLRTSHVANLAVGRGFRAIKAARPEARVGTSVRVAACEPATGSGEDVAAAERCHRFRNAWFLDPILRGRYPHAFIGRIPYDSMRVREGDLETARVPLDFVGLGSCGCPVVAYDPGDTSRIGLAYKTSEASATRGREQAMRDVSSRVARDYGCTVLEITSNRGRDAGSQPAFGISNP
jgi:beta-glucosidase